MSISHWSSSNADEIITLVDRTREVSEAQVWHGQGIHWCILAIFSLHQLSSVCTNTQQI